MAGFADDIVEQRKDLEDRDHWKAKAEQLQDQLRARNKELSKEAMHANLVNETVKHKKRYDKVMEKWLEFKKKFQMIEKSKEGLKLERARLVEECAELKQRKDLAMLMYDPLQV